MLTLTMAQLALLGGALVLASFGLNAFFFRYILTEFRERFERIDKSLTGENGILVRVAVLEERRSGIDRRRSGVVQ